MAPLWVAYEANLGTLLRTCDAVGACLAAPRTDHYQLALRRGDTLVRRPHIHWVDQSKQAWVRMVGRGASLNVAVAGWLVLYRLAGLM